MKGYSAIGPAIALTGLLCLSSGAEAQNKETAEWPAAGLVDTHLS